jgi:conjugative relaxase-like TrwC/TraI family protein
VDRRPAVGVGGPFGGAVVAVMTLHKLTAGDGYLYLMRHVAKADADPTHVSDVQTTPTTDAAGYYTAEGNPPGVWLGAGARVLGVAGMTVTEAQMRNLFGVGAHPDADRIQAEYLTEHARAGMTDRQLRELARAAGKHAQLGRRFSEFKPLAPLGDRVRERTAALEDETGRPATAEEVARITSAESRRAAGAVAGFDLVFTPVKSLALLWALDPRASVREAIRLAHEQAMTETLAFLEAHAAHTRTGADGVAQVDTAGLVAVAFTHYDSRAGDPNLHTHVAVSNKVQGVDGVWRALDARGLHAMAVTASEHYNTRIQTHVADRLALAFEARQTERGRQPVVEVAGIPQPVLDHFSRRRAQLEAHYDQLLADYRTRHGRDPDFATSRALAEQANLATRAGKKPPRSLEEMRDAWRRDLLDTFGPSALDAILAAVPTAAPAERPGPDPDPAARLALVPGTSEHDQLVAALTREVLTAVEERRSTWSLWNLRAEAERALRDPQILTRHHLTAAGATRLADLAEAATDRAAGPGFSIRIDPPALVNEPAALRRADGTSVFTRHGADRYTSARVLDAEARLLTAATTVPEHPAPAPTPEQVQAALNRLRTDQGLTLDPGQAELVTAFAADPKTLVVGLGPAGTGKTTAMRALKTVLDQTGTGRLIPLATSAHAASVLAEDLGAPAENVHKFLADHDAGSPAANRLRTGDVVLVDEAGMAGTPNLDRILTLAHTARARVRLLGDDRQLAAVESGGALRLLATEAGAVELDVVHRFDDPAEAAATLRLRTGDHQALAFYQAHGRIRGGSRQDMTEAAYTAWLTDVHAGRTSVLATTTTADVTRLAARARTDRVAAGQVEPGGVLLHDGNTAGAGDWVITRHNDRRLATNDRRVWVRNGDGWRVVHRRDDGALTVAHLRHGARLVLPAAYVAAHVELLYATTAHRVQGATVDTAHALITPEAAREHLYVLATRARTATHLYVATHAALPADEDDRVDRRAWDPAGTDATVILARILDRESAETSATQAIRDAQDQAACLATLCPATCTPCTS